jgi:hypothetical protein
MWTINLLLFIIKHSVGKISTVATGFVPFVSSHYAWKGMQDRHKCKDESKYFEILVSCRYIKIHMKEEKQIWKNALLNDAELQPLLFFQAVLV